MLTWILILLGLYLVYRLFRKRSATPDDHYPAGGFGGLGMGGMAGGMILGYLLANHLIDQNQHDMWRSLPDDQLRETLVSQGIVNDADYQNLAGQAAAGALPYDSGSDWSNGNSADTSSFDDFGDGGFGDGGDF